MILWYYGIMMVFTERKVDVVALTFNHMNELMVIVVVVVCGGCDASLPPVLQADLIDLSCARPTRQ